MKTVYKIKGFIAHASIDNWVNGCNIDGQTIFDDYLELVADTLPALLEKVKDHFLADDEALLLDACDEDGRLDVQVYQREAFDIAKLSPKVEAAFQAGERDIYLVDYSMQIQKIITEFSLTEEMKGA